MHRAERGEEIVDALLDAARAGPGAPVDGRTCPTRPALRTGAHDAARRKTPQLRRDDRPMGLLRFTIDARCDTWSTSHCHPRGDGVDQRGDQARGRHWVLLRPGGSRRRGSGHGFFTIAPSRIAVFMTARSRRYDRAIEVRPAVPRIAAVPASRTPEG
jgi:hypothetical protein